MERPLSVLIVEDEQDVCKQFVDYIDGIDDISIVGITNNAVKAVEYLKDYLPDAVILDLELHYGAGNGLQFLQNMKLLSISSLPFVLITTHNSSATTYEYARQLGADFIMYKHQCDYSIKNVVEFLLAMKTVIQNRKVSVTPTISDNESANEKEKRLRRRISAELNNVAISPKAIGYQYLIDAILTVMDKPTQNICTLIGKKYGKTESSVERAMQNAIGRAWRTADINMLLMHYTAKISSDKGVPTITEFIYFYANKIKNDY